MTGGAVYLFPVPENGRLMVAEGIETALAARELFNAHDWGLCAALSANGMKRLELSDGIKELAVIADHDAPRPVGETAALSLAKRAQSGGIAVRYWISGTAGYDALDELNDRKRSGKA
ncbi:TPA: toprim domain-containing protein [Neisseria meningitidis]